MAHNTVAAPKVGDTLPAAADGPARTLPPTDRQLAELALHEARQTRKLLEAMGSDIADIREVLDEVSVLIDEAGPLLEGLAKGGLGGIMGALMGGPR